MTGNGAAHERQRPPLFLAEFAPTRTSIQTKEHPLFGDVVVLGLIGPEVQFGAVLMPDDAVRCGGQLEGAGRVLGAKVKAAKPGDVEQAAKARAATDGIRQRGK